MITIFEAFPKHLNLNGDLGNGLVLEKLASWSGARVTRISADKLPSARPDVVIIGHGSTDAWKQIYRNFAEMIPTLEKWMAEGTVVLAVGSGYAALHGLVSSLPKSVERTARQSVFEVSDFEGSKLIGYRNTDLVLPSLKIDGSLIGTMLHGPVLAKNLWLARRILESAGVQIQKNVKTESVAKLASAAIELETELAGE